MLVIPPRAELRARPVESTRLLLTPLEPVDANDLWQAVEGSRDHLQRWLAWVPYNTDVDASLLFASACAADWDAGRAVRFAVRDRRAGAFLGVVGLEGCVHMHRACELGYWLRREATGKGLMTEAARTALEFAFVRMGVHRARVAAATDNHASLRVIARLGFHFEGIARQAEYCDGRWIDHAVFAMLSTDWTPAR